MVSEAFGRLGGDAVLDLVNTVAWRLDAARRVDRLRDYGDVVRFARQCEVIAADEADQLTGLARSSGDAGASEWQKLVTFREAVYRAVLTPEKGLAGVHAHYLSFVATAQLVPETGVARWTLPVAIDLVRLRLAERAVDLFTREPAHRLRQCADDACGWVFLDRSPRQGRRWCSSADCGNRNRARTHYRRQRGAAAPPTPSRPEG